MGFLVLRFFCAEVVLVVFVVVLYSLPRFGFSFAILVGGYLGFYGFWCFVRCLNRVFFLFVFPRLAMSLPNFYLLLILMSFL